MNSDTVYDDTAPIPGGEDPRGRSQSAARRAVLAGIGAAATACDTAGEQFDRFVDRGQQARKDLQERSEDVRRQNWRARSRAREYFRGAMDIILDAFNVPSRTDVDT